MPSIEHVVVTKHRHTYLSHSKEGMGSVSMASCHHWVLGGREANMCISQLLPLIKLLTIIGTFFII